MMELQGRIAVVTGGASGIGAACVVLLRQQGARVAVWDIRTGVADDAVFCDVTKPESVASAMAETRQRFGTPSLLVAAAGMSAGSRILDLSVEDWDRVYAVNIRGVMLTVQAVARQLAREELDGSIVLISSVNGVVADPGMSAYSSSKAAVYHFARVAAREFGPLKIRINAVGPGATDTPMLAKHMSREGYVEELVGRTPLGEVGTPERVAEVIVGLMRMDWVTGQALLADGGSSLNTGRKAWNTGEVLPPAKT